MAWHAAGRTHVCCVGRPRLCGGVRGVPNTRVPRPGSPGYVDDASEAGPVSCGVPNTRVGPE